ncbi:thioredoxin domain-containing protein 11 isoform X2 [Cephus cinctus]|uniref:Thioredoxin domain-containing protein 11 isoform X2 n=1 Tax=Cephus cinctus TaxID=211228 RepID=A0AAJ7CEG7_CEPCN|nr:thioredoxin domain-containing protein 11 isoform X2 [Cephus cinctus]
MSSEEHEPRLPRNADNFPATPDTGSDNEAKSQDRRLSVEEKLASRMIFHAREICFFLAIVFTALAALHTSPPKISKPPLAKPFFNQSSVVLDFYKGHLDAVFERGTDADFSFLMYYAPWDADSQALRHEFETVARYYHNRVFFAAINCWHPGSECRTQYNKIQSYPVLMVYPSKGLGVQYKGIRSALYMIRFLDAFMNPIHRITKEEEIADLLTTYDAVIVGYFNFTGVAKSPGYIEFYKTAIRHLEKDPNREIIFAAITDPVTAQADYDVTQFPSATLFMWSESKTYIERNRWSSENLLNWISSALVQAPLWLQPPGSKSVTLAPYLRDGPALILFTPRNPLHLQNYNYNLIKEVGLQYYNCGNNPTVDNVVTRLQENRHNAITRQREKSEHCEEILKEPKVPLHMPTISVSIQQWINDSCCANIVMNKCLLCKKKIVDTMKNQAPICTTTTEHRTPMCKGADIFSIPTLKEEQEKYELCCNRHQVSDDKNDFSKSNSKSYETSMLTGENDPRSANNVRRSFIKEDCRKLLTGNNYHPPVFPKDLPGHPNINLTELRCKVNRTLVLIAIDSLQYHHYAEGLGIDILNKRNKTAVVIIEPTQESQYVMKEDLSRYSLVQFINNYTEGMLQRTLRSVASRRFAHKTRIECEPNDNSKICVPELTTETFLDTILNPTMDVVVMYHSPYCAFCSAIAYVYLTAAHYLSNMDRLIFVRIDGDNNDLPWEYTMNRYPSILFFPARRKEDSTVFPFSLPITIRNLLNFVLANLDGDSNVEALVNVCHIGAGEPSSDCVARIRWVCLDIIEELLREYRKLRRKLSLMNKRTACNKRRSILLKLQHIRDVHLILGSTNDLRKDVDKVRVIQEKYRTYYRDLMALDVYSEAIEDVSKRTDEKQTVTSTESNTAKDEL